MRSLAAARRLAGVTTSSIDRHALLESQTEPFHVGNRTRSTALLAWFIETVMRLDPTDVEDAICDGGGDKGIDGIVFDQDANEIFVLQAKHRQNTEATQGDADLQRFLGVAPYFDGAAGIASLLASSPNAEVVALVERLKLPDHLASSSPTVRLVFVTNAPRDAAARDYLATVEDQSPTIDLWDRDRLAEVAVRTAHRELLAGKYTLHDVGDVLRAELTGAAQIALALVPATELVRLPGIDNLTIFDLNVRLGLGNTKINRELRSTITTASEHELFPTYHNGLTLLTDGLRVTDEGMELDGVAVVNGCQSLLALHRERASITPDLKLVTKVVELGASSELADRITYRSNNQNPVNIRDQRSNDRIQRDLQEQVERDYSGLLFYDIRRGQPASAAEEILENQLAAQLLMAVWLKEPWNAVRKVRLFDQDYHRIFRRASAHHLYLAFLIDQAINGARPKLSANLQTAFASVRFTLAYLIGRLLAESEHGAELLDSPSRWLPDSRSEVAAKLAVFADFVVDEINYFLTLRDDERAEDPTMPPFDPKTTFKSQTGVRHLERQVVQAIKALARRPDSDILFGLPAVR